MARVFKTRRAEEDLDDIWFYIAQDSPNSADRWLDVVLEKASFLAERPGVGRARPDLLPDSAPDLRSFPMKNYMLFYRPVPGGVKLVRVLHAPPRPGLEPGRLERIPKSVTHFLD